MRFPIAAVDEDERLVALRRYSPSDIGPNRALDDLTALAARICDAPMAFVSFVDVERQWFRSGARAALGETPRAISFCGRAIQQRDVLVVPDAREDERFTQNPLVTGDARIRFYAGAPLRTPEGHALGTLCVLDRVPRQLTPLQIDTLSLLAGQVLSHFDLRRNARELAESEARLRMVTANARVGMVVVNADRTYASANALYAEILGLPSSAIVGLRVADVLPVVYEDQIRPWLDRAFAGERVGYELHIPRAESDGRYTVRYEPVRLDGKVEQVAVVITDVSEHRQAEAASTRLAAIVESSLDAIIGMALDGTVTSWNAGAERLFGYAAVDMIGESIMRLIPATHREEEVRLLARIRCGEAVGHFETQRLTREGGLIDVSVTASPIRDSAGKIVGSSKVARDISERKRADQALRFQQTMLTTERELTPDGILAIDADGRVLSFNRRFGQMWGITADVLSTRADTELLQAVQAKLRFPEKFMHRVRALYDRPDESSEDEVELADGRTFERHSAPMRDPEGRYYGRIWYFRDATDRKQAEAAVRSERDRAQQYLDTAGVILLALDMQGRITLVNRHAGALLGWEAAELLGRDFIDTCVPARLRSETRNKLRVVQTGDDSVVENPVVTRAGDERLIEWRTAFLRDGAGRIIGTLSSGSDITERRRAESRVREERDRAQRFLDTAEVILLALDLEGKITLINRKGCDLLGWTEAELLGQSWVDTCLPERVRGELTRKLERLTGGDVSHVENPIRSRDGSERLIEWRNRVLRDDDGRTIGTFSSGTDITERHAAIAALRATEERMRFALEGAGVGIWDMDYKTGVVRWSSTLETHYGLVPGSFDGTFTAFLERIHPDDRGTVLATIEKAAKSGADFSVQNRALWPDGTVRWLTGAGRIIFGEDGEPVRAVGISLDVTANRQLEEQYHQAQKMEAVGRLAGGIAHDFNNLLGAMLLYCEVLLCDRGEDDPERADIEEIQKAAMRAAALTRQLLAFSRKEIIEPTILELNAVVADMRAMLERLIGEDVNVAVTLRPELWAIKADRGQVEQILLNLAVNARDAMPRGGTLTIETANVDLDDDYARTHADGKSGPHVMLTVSDTGTGMTPEVQARLFEPFFTTKEVGKGTGLGLATVHGIVMRGGGSVGVDSELGKGTSFRVYFPRANPEAVIEATAPSIQAHAGGETILVVEDSEGLREIARRILERHGYTVLVAANADEARRLFDSNASIDVLLTDVVMPGKSGSDLTQELVEQRPALSVIYMSGYTEDAIAHHGVLKPGIAFLQKPFTSETLGRKLRDVLDHGARGT